LKVERELQFNTAGGSEFQFGAAALLNDRLANDVCLVDCQRVRLYVCQLGGVLHYIIVVHKEWIVYVCTQRCGVSTRSPVVIVQRECDSFVSFVSARKLPHVRVRESRGQSLSKVLTCDSLGLSNQSIIFTVG